MKKGLFSLLLLVLVSFHTLVLSQDTKPKQPVNANADCTVEITVTGNKLTLDCAPVGKKIEIFSVVGVKVTEIEIKTSSGEYTLSVPKGYYILRINDIVRKVAIR